MPRFFLHIREGGRLIQDPEGSDLPDVQAARNEAIEAAREIVAWKVTVGEDVSALAIEIADETGTALATVPMRDILKL